MDHGFHMFDSMGTVVSYDVYRELLEYPLEPCLLINSCD